MKSGTPSWNQFGPRVGLAFSLTEKTVIRSGFGMFYEPNNINGLSNISANGFFGLAQYVSADNGLTPSFPARRRIPAELPAGALARSDIHQRTERQHAFRQRRCVRIREPVELRDSASVRRQFPVGCHLRGLERGKDNIRATTPSTRFLPNTCRWDRSCSRASLPMRPGRPGFRLRMPGFTGTVAQALRPFPQYQGIGEFYEKDGHTTYQSLQVKAEKRYSSGLTALAAFTWEKNLVNADYPLSGGNSLFGLAAPQDNADYRSLKSYSPNDVPTRLVVSYIYELPFGKGKRFSLHGPVNLLFGGWQLSGIYSYQNSLPLGFSTNLANPLFGGPIRPNVGTDPFRAPVAGSKFDPFKDNYISPRFMTLPSAFTFGNAALRYNFRGFAVLQRGHDAGEDFPLQGTGPRGTALGGV